MIKATALTAVIILAENYIFDKPISGAHFLIAWFVALYIVIQRSD